MVFKIWVFLRVLSVGIKEVELTEIFKTPKKARSLLFLERKWVEKFFSLTVVNNAGTLEPYIKE